MNKNIYKFEWDDAKELLNRQKHDISFEDAQYAFADRKRIIAHDEKHSKSEQRLFCIGKIPLGVVCVRFTIRDDKIRIIGANKDRRWKKIYEQRTI